MLYTRIFQGIWLCKVLHAITFAGMMHTHMTAIISKLYTCPTNGGYWLRRSDDHVGVERHGKR